jgi:hypothetical protein
LTQTDKDKRKALRIQPFVVPCKIAQGDRRSSAYLTDLSLHGARVVSDTALPQVGETIALEVRFGRRPTSRLTARVIWTKPPAGDVGPCFGLSFEGLGSEEQQVLDNVVTEFRRRAELLV